MTRDALERALERVRSRFSGELGFAASNLATGETVEIAADRRVPTASVIKLAVLVELFRQVAAGEIDLERRLALRAAAIVPGSGILKELAPGLRPTVRDLATLMVVISDNTATNLLIDLVGGVGAVNETVQRRLGLATIVLHDRIDFERIGGEGRRLAEGTPRELARLMELLGRGELVDAASSAAMLAILQRQQYLDQVPRYLAVNPYARELRLEPPPPLWVANKTGFSAGVRVDAGLIGLPEEHTIAYCAATAGSADASFAAEAEGAVTNGLLGRLVCAYWWPGGEIPDGVLLPSPYVDALLG